MAMIDISQYRAIQIFLVLALILNITFWFSVRDMGARWGNVPPPPDIKYAASYGLGDASFAYRINGIMIQNLGDTGGMITPLEDYNYETLSNWFYLQDHLDQTSDFTPYLAAYYFGSVQNPSLLPPLLNYLSDVGGRSYGEKWRWLAQGVFLARYKLKDLDKALKMAEFLADTKNDNVPAWVRQMPAFVLSARGEKEAAYAILLEILKSRGENLHPNEVNATKAYICTRILDKKEAKSNPLCENIQ